MALKLAQGLAGWLRAHQCPRSGRVVDPVHQVAGTYADGFAALAFALLGWEGPMQASLRVASNRPVDSEFDQLALALLQKLVQADLEQPRLYAGEALVSNNWAIFRAFTRELRGQPGDYSLLQRQLDSGLFPDCPLGQATPTCYHAKICATLALQTRLCPGENFREPLRRGLEALLWLVAPSGALVPYGRSRHSLFAYASAYLATRLGAGLFQDPRYQWASETLLNYLRSYQHADGHIPAVLNHQEWLREDWDVYINNPDYNAYAAACLLLGERLGQSMPSQPPAFGLQDLGPLLVWREDSSYFACSGSGEWVPLGTPFFCDTRYAGLLPLVHEGEAGTHFFDNPYCWDGRDSTRGYLVDPRSNPWLPYRQSRGKLYWVRKYHDLEWSLRDEVLRLSGRGCPAHSRPVPRWRRFFSQGHPPQFVTQELTQPTRVELCYDRSQSLLRQHCEGLWREQKL